MQARDNLTYLWEETHEVRYHDADFTGHATCEALCRFMQETAWHHAEHLGAGHAQFQKKQLIWVLSRLSITIDTSPAWGDAIQLHTWMSGRDRLFCYRDFRFEGEKGVVLAEATTTWFAVDQRRRRPQRTDSYLEVEPHTNERAEQGRPKPIASLDTPDHERTHQVGYRDLDTNSHVNNAAYVGWVMDSLPLEFHRAHVLRALDIEYLAEALHDDELSISAQGIGAGTYRHAVVRDSEGVELCRAESAWVQRRL